MFEICEIKHKAEYNPLLILKQAPFTQAGFYGEWQEMMGRKVRRFEIIRPRRTSLGLEKDSEIVGFFQVIKYPLLFSQSFLYVPHGPILKEVSYLGDEFLKTFHDKLLEITKEENAIFVRFDPFPKTENNFDKYFKKTPISHYHSSYFQPKFEWILNLEKPEEEILNEMHPKTRYNINLAQKRGIKIEIVNENFEKYFNDFNKLLEETARRDNFGLHPKIYYQNIFKTLNSENAFLVIAGYKGKILLVNLVLLYGRAAYFAFGGSSGEHKNLMFSHLAQWEAIKEAKRRGFEVYNFGGIGNGGEELEGVSFFKKRFGGGLLEYSDSYDLILKPFWYWLYNLYKKFQIF